MINVVKIIETNIITDGNEIKDHQSRIIEANSWEEYIQAFANYDGKSVEFKSLTSMIGCTINRELEITDIKYDDFHLSCRLSNSMFTNKHLAYLVKQHISIQFGDCK